MLLIITSWIVLLISETWRIQEIVKQHANANEDLNWLLTLPAYRSNSDIKDIKYTCKIILTRSWTQIPSNGTSIVLRFTALWILDVFNEVIYIFWTFIISLDYLFMTEAYWLKGLYNFFFIGNTTTPSSLVSPKDFAVNVTYFL